MTDERDPTLQALFAGYEQDLAADEFTAQVMANIDKLKRRAMLAWVVFGLTLAACAWLLATPLQHGVNLLTEGLSVPLVDLEEPWLAQLLLPLNSVAGAVAIGLIGLRFTFRRVK